MRCACVELCAASIKHQVASGNAAGSHEWRLPKTRLQLNRRGLRAGCVARSRPAARLTPTADLQTGRRLAARVASSSSMLLTTVLAGWCAVGPVACASGRDTSSQRAPRQALSFALPLSMACSVSALPHAKQPLARVSLAARAAPCCVRPLLGSSVASSRARPALSLAAAASSRRVSTAITSQPPPHLSEAAARNSDGYEFMRWEVANVYDGTGEYAGLTEAERRAFAPLKAAEVAAYMYGVQHPVAAAVPPGPDTAPELVHGALPSEAAAAVVVPVHVRDAAHVALLAALLNSLAAQSITDELAFIFVDDASPAPDGGNWWAGSGAAAAALARLPQGRAAVLHRRCNAGAAAARDAGMRAARDICGARYVLLADVDVVASPDWAAAHLAEQKRSDSDGGGIVCGFTTAASSDAASRFHDECGHLNPRFRRADGGVAYGTTCNMSLDLAAAHTLPDGAFLDARFPGASYEDIELCVRNAAHGVPLRFAPDARVRHEFAPPGGEPLTALFERFRRYGASEHLLFQAHPHVSYRTLYADTRPLRLRDWALSAAA